MMTMIICDCSAHRLEDVCQLGDDGGGEGGGERHRAQEVDLVLQLLQTWRAELLGIIRNYAELFSIFQK